MTPRLSPVTYAQPHPAVAFPTKPEWPVYEAPARWYIQTGRFGAAS